MWQVRLGQFFAINDRAAMFKSNRFAGHAYNAFHEHDTRAGHADAHDIPTLRFGMTIGQPVYKIDSPVPISGEHAVALDANRQDDISENEELEKNETEYRKNECSDERSLRIPPNQHDAQPTRGR